LLLVPEGVVVECRRNIPLLIRLASVSPFGCLSRIHHRKEMSGGHHTLIDRNRHGRLGLDCVKIH
jgi:hypothetical protein